jgi:hypothetical protein
VGDVPTPIKGIGTSPKATEREFLNISSSSPFRAVFDRTPQVALARFIFTRRAVDESNVAQSLTARSTCGRCEEELSASRHPRGHVIAHAMSPSVNKEQNSGMSETGSGVTTLGLVAKGRLIGNNDLWIGAHAIALDVTLATNNEREFRRIAGLSVENWPK